ncbi:hypothetical protein ACHAXA_000469, partial [Cyclostephanos tholiformis]
AFEDDSQTSRAPISQSTYYLLSNNTYYQESTMSSSPYHAELELAKSAALKAGEIIRKYSGNSGRSNNSAVVCVKSGVDLVTEADTHVERVVTQIIKAAFPEDDIVGEEDQVEFPKGRQDDPFPTGRICKLLIDSAYNFISIYPVDPIDGTTNFVHNYPFVAISIGFIVSTRQQREVELEHFSMVNQQELIVTPPTSVEDCLLVNNIGHCRRDDFIDESTDRVNKWLRANLRGYRSSGSAAQNLAHVASGQVSCYYEHGYGGPWDVCAGIVLVKEAGGVVWDARDGTDLQMRFGKGSVCAGGKRVVEDVLRVAGKPTTTFSKG